MLKCNIQLLLHQTELNLCREESKQHFSFRHSFHWCSLKNATRLLNSVICVCMARVTMISSAKRFKACFKRVRTKQQ